MSSFVTQDLVSKLPPDVTQIVRKQGRRRTGDPANYCDAHGHAEWELVKAAAAGLTDSTGSVVR